MKKSTKGILIIVLLLVIGLIYYFYTTREDVVIDGPAPEAPASNVAKINYAVKKTYPHDTGSYTQGLMIYKGNMYEGTGLNSASRLMKIDINTGKAAKTHALDKEFFGEGITILNDTIYQLTWQNNVVFVYTLPDFKKVKEFRLETEGWGITSDGKQLMVSDGSNNLYFYDPATFHLLKTIPVKEDGYPAQYLNEMEYIDGFIYANQYTSPYILKIDPKDGTVVGKIDVTELWKRAKTIHPNVDVPNGIAYDEATKKIYITGKLWPELYEIELSK